MRLIGTLPTAQQAERFVDYLLTCHIDANSDARADGQVDIWIRDEDRVVVARQALDEYMAAPDAAVYANAKSQAEQIRQERFKKVAQAVSLRRRMPTTSAGPMGISSRGPITVIIAIAAVILTLATNFSKPAARQVTDSNGEVRFELNLAERLSFVDRPTYMATNDPLAAIKRGEVWRFLTPALMHGSVAHLIFNLLAMISLGSLCEGFFGRRTYLLLILSSHLLGTALQVLVPPGEFGGSPFFVGLSGVVYGLFGFLWIRPKFHPSIPQILSQSGVIMMMFWFLICWVPGSGIANWAHLGGLIAGMLLAITLPTTMNRA